MSTTAGKLKARGMIHRHAHLGRQHASVTPNAQSKAMYGHLVELCKSTIVDTIPNARLAAHVKRSLNILRSNSLALITIPPTAHIKRFHALGIWCCSATMASPQARRLAGNKASMKRFRHLAMPSRRNSYPSSLISRPSCDAPSTLLLSGLV